MNSVKPELQAENSGCLKPILIRKDNGDGNNNRNQPKKRVTFKQCVEYLPDIEDTEMDEMYLVNFLLYSNYLFNFNFNYIFAILADERGRWSIIPRKITRNQICRTEKDVKFSSFFYFTIVLKYECVSWWRNPQVSKPFDSFTILPESKRSTTNLAGSWKCSYLSDDDIWHPSIPTILQVFITF